MKIRLANIHDLDVLVQYGEEFWESTQFSHIPYSGQTVRNLLLDLMSPQTDGFVLVVCDEDTVVGFGLVNIANNIFNPSIRMAGELAFFLDKEYRSKGVASKLLNAMEVIAHTRGCMYMNMISMSDSMDAGPLYEHLGYTKAESTYTKEL